MERNKTNIIKLLTTIQDKIYWGEIKLNLFDNPYMKLSETDQALHDIYRHGAVRGIEICKNEIRKIYGEKEKCSWRDYYGENDYDYDTGCGKFRVGSNPGKFCQFCGKEIEK